MYIEINNNHKNLLKKKHALMFWNGPLTKGTLTQDKAKEKRLPRPKVVTQGCLNEAPGRTRDQLKHQADRARPQLETHDL